MKDQYAVFGNPIDHSKSPIIHTEFARLTNQSLAYNKFKVGINSFADAADSFFSKGGKGLNITVPFKMDAYHYAEHLTERALLAGSINTLTITSDGIIQGDNTDGVGLVTDIVTNLGWRIKDRKVLILGAGGAVRGIIGPLLSHSPKFLAIANRTPSKAQLLADSFSHLAKIHPFDYDHLEQLHFDLIINGTSASLSGNLPPLPNSILTDDSCCYDMMYSNQPTIFNQWGIDNGAKATADGLGMLVEQAAESFRLWRGIKPKTHPVIKLLRNDNL